YEMIMGLLEEIDLFDRDDIVFWADEPGTWQLGIDWARVIPPYLACLSKVLTPREFRARATVLMRQLDPLDAVKMRRLLGELPQGTEAPEHVGSAMSEIFRVY